MKAYPLQCPHCGQSVTAMRFGIRLRPLWLRIVDAVVRAGPGGISRPDLTALIYGDQIIQPNTISVHINHINDELLSTDYVIKGGRDGYRIVRAPVRVTM